MKLVVTKVSEKIAIRFVEWVYENRYETYSGFDEWIEKGTRKLYSTKQLFEKFLSESK